jgi:hypothetical protein
MILMSGGRSWNRMPIYDWRKPLCLLTAILAFGIPTADAQIEDLSGDLLNQVRIIRDPNVHNDRL